MLFVKSKLSNYLAHTFIFKSGILRLNSHQQQTGWGSWLWWSVVWFLLVLCQPGQLCNYQGEEHNVQIRPRHRYPSLTDQGAVSIIPWMKIFKRYKIKSFFKKENPKATRSVDTLIDLRMCQHIWINLNFASNSNTVPCTRVNDENIHPSE